MDKVTIKANAKVNLILNVMGKDQNGYHQLSGIMQEVSLHDIIHISESDRITVSCNDEALSGKDNICYKAAELMSKHYGIKGANIHIEKNIPKEAGLGGGSSDGAATLKGLDKLYNLNLSSERLLEHAFSLGADVPFFIEGGISIAEGYGEKLARLAKLESYYLVICKGRLGLSTKAIFEGLKEYHHSKERICLSDYKSIKDIIPSMNNDLYVVSRQLNEEIEAIIERFNSLGSLKAMMSGSGPSVFGIFDDEDLAIRAYKALNIDYKETYLTTNI